MTGEFVSYVARHYFTLQLLTLGLMIVATIAVPFGQKKTMAAMTTLVNIGALIAIICDMLLTQMQIDIFSATRMICYLFTAVALAVGYSFIALKSKG